MQNSTYIESEETPINTMAHVVSEPMESRDGVLEMVQSSERMERSN